MVADTPVGDPTGDDLTVEEPGRIGTVNLEPGAVLARDALSETVANGDGSVTSTFGIRPQHWQDASGAWRDFDNRLTPPGEPTPDVVVTNRTGPFDVGFASPEAVAAGAPAVSLSVGDRRIATVAIGAAPRDVSTDGASVTYAQAWPGADLRYTLDNERIKEEIVLAERPLLPPTFTFALQLDGLTSKAAADGGLTFSDAAGLPTFSMPPLVMSDSAADPAFARVGFELSIDDAGATVLVVTPDPTWLADPARVYPVTIDPSLAFVGAQPASANANNVHVNQAAPTTNYYGATTMTVGKTSTGQRRNALISFPSLTGFPADSVVTHATLKLHASSGTNGLGLEVVRSSSAWEDSTVTWNTAPSLGSVHATGTATVGTHTSFDITKLVGSWLGDSLGNFGVTVRSTSGNNANVSISSSWSTCGGCRPELEITYVPATRYGYNSLWTQTSSQYGGGNSAAVEVSGGNLAFTHAGGSIPARGFNVDLTHTYNSADPFGSSTGAGAGVYGEGWTFSWNLRLFEVDGGAGVIFKDGAGDESLVFVDDGTVSGTRNYRAPPHYRYRLTKDVSSPLPDEVWTLTSVAGTVDHYFDAEGKLTRIEDRNANTLAFGYDTSDRLTTITDVAGRDTILEYGAAGGLLSRIVDMAGRESIYTYTDGNLTSVTHANGTSGQVTTQFGYDDARRLVSVTNPNGKTSEFRYSAFNRWETAGSVDGWGVDAGDPALSHSTVHVHSGTGALQVALAGVDDTPEGVQRVIGGDALAATAQELVVWIFLTPNATGVEAQLELKYVDHQATASTWQPLATGQWTAVRMPAAQIEARGQVQEIEIGFRRIAGQPTFNGNVWIDDLALRGQIASQSDAKPTPNTVVTYAYAPELSQSEVARPNSSGTFQTTTYEYTDLGAVSHVTDPLGNETDYARDELLRISEITPPGEASATYALGYYPNSTQLQTVTNGAQEISRLGADPATADTRYAIDPLNEANRAAGGGYNATIVSRQAATGNVLSVATNRYSAGSDLEADPFPTPYSEYRRHDFGYTTGGLLYYVDDARGHRTYFGWDHPTGYLERINAPEGDGEATNRITDFTRNPDGTVNTLTDPAGQVTTFGYDALGRLTSVTHGLGEPDELTVSYDLDANGNLVGVTDAAGSTTWTYDENNRLIEESRTQNGTTKTAEYAYFANGTLQTLTTFAGQTVSFNYDNGLRLTAQTDPNAGGSSIAFRYDTHNRRDRVTYPSGVRQTETFDIAGRVTNLLLEQSTGTDLQSFTYNYGFDSSGNRTSAYAYGFATSVAELGGASTSFTYDSFGRLSGATRTGSQAYTQSYSYDDTDNRLTKTSGGTTTTYTYDDANQLISGGSTTYDYDRNGNLTRAGSDAFTYDPANKWTSGDVNGVALAYEYDGLGRQVSRTQGTSTRTDFWYDQTGLSQTTGATAQSYLRDPGGLLLSLKSATSLYNYGSDRLGSITGVTNTFQNLVNDHRYDPWGQTLAPTTEAVGQPFRFTGGVRDASSGFHTFGQRHYAWSLGRWTQIDPLPGSVIDINRHAYAGCNPANFVDPTGTQTWNPYSEEFIDPIGEIAVGPWDCGVAQLGIGAGTAIAGLLELTIFGFALVASQGILAPGVAPGILSAASTTLGGISLAAAACE